MTVLKLYLPAICSRTLVKSGESPMFAFEKAGADARFPLVLELLVHFIFTL